jgi:Skp family chaperone for outer membrane proteins
VLNVKCSFAWAAVAAGTLQFVTAATPLFAQAPAVGRPAMPVAQRPSGTNVAVIDISLVFEKYPKFQAQMQALKGEVEAFEKKLRVEQEKMTKLRDDLQGYTPGSPQYKAKEEEMAKMGSSVQVDMALQRKEFLEKEARIYFDAYNEVYGVVAELADRHDIKLVLRFNSEEMKPEDRSSVLQGVNRAVVFQRNLNITGLVVKELGGSMEAPAAPQQSPGLSGQSGTAGRPVPGTRLK